MSKKMNISIEMKPVTVEIEVDEKATKAEIIKAAEVAFLSAVTTKFPSASYHIMGEVDATSITFDNVFVGQAVQTVQNGLYGIITKINKKTVSATLAQKNGFNSQVNGHTAAFRKVDDTVNLAEVLPKRSATYKGMGVWGEGEVGYFVDSKNNKVIFVAIAKVTSAGNHQIYEVNVQSDKFWKLNNEQMKRFVFDTIEEAEAELKNDKRGR